MSSRKQSSKPDFHVIALWQRENLPLKQLAKRLGVPVREARARLRYAFFALRRGQYSNRGRSK
jgi:DNA-directed RNA polymerase specialized sigma24 family protein